MIVVNILLVLNVSAYYSTIAEGMILILAVLAGFAQRAIRRWRGRSARALHAAAAPGAPARCRASGGRATGAWLCRRRRPSARDRSRMPSFLVRHAETLRYALPAYVCFVLVVVVTQLVLGHAMLNWRYYNSLIVLSSLPGSSWRSARAR